MLKYLPRFDLKIRKKNYPIGNTSSSFFTTFLLPGSAQASMQKTNMQARNKNNFISFTPYKFFDNSIKYHLSEKKSSETLNKTHNFHIIYC